MESVLILGGSYFVGKSIVDHFVSNNYDVYTLNRGTKKSLNKNVTELYADRDNEEEMKSALENRKFTYVIDVSGLNENQANIITKVLPIDNMKRFVFISSSSVYDIEHLQTPFTETDALAENKYWEEYGKDKILAEQTYTKWCSEKKRSLCILRPPYVYGPNNYARRESFIFNHIENDRTIIVPHSNNKIQFISADDLAEIVMTMCTVPILSSSVFNVGNSNSLSFTDWIQLCAEVMQKDASIKIYPADGIYDSKEYFPFHEYDNVLDVTRIKTIYKKETSMKKVLQEAYHWYLENKDSIEFKESVTACENNILGIN